MKRSFFAHVVAPHRVHVEQGLIEVDTMYRDTLSTSVVKMPKEVLHALVGSEISATDFLKIDKTLLAEILQAEPGFSIKGVTEESGQVQAKQDEEDLEQELNELMKKKSKDEKDFDLYDFLRAEQQKAPPKKPVITESSSKDDMELTPYKDDIDYLGLDKGVY